MLAISDIQTADPCPSPFNMAAYVLAQADRFPDKCALSIVGGDARDSWTFAELKSAVLGCATGLLHTGLRPGDRLLMRVGNSVDFPIGYLAAISVGIVPVPTSSQLTEPEISTIGELVQPQMILAEDGVALPRPLRCPVIGLDEFRAMRRLAPATFGYGDPERAAYMIFTSGTGGKPRGVVHAHRAIWARRMMWQGWYGLRSDDRLLHAGAFNWTYTLGTGLMDPWAIGATALIPAGSVRAPEIPAILAGENATIFAAAPGVFRQVLKAPMPPLPNLRHALSAGEKMPDVTLEHWQQATGTQVYEAYGMSECSTFISASPARPAIGGSAGYPQTGRRVAILSETGVATHGEAGVISIGADDPGLMLGYLNEPELTRARFRDGWFMTGDTGNMDAQGAIRFLGREDDMMNAGGYRVSPLEVENVFRLRPDIQDCAAVQVGVKKDASVIVLFFESDGKPNQCELEAYAKDKLARYKQPRIYKQIDALPRGANGKMLRRELRQVELPDKF